MPRDMWGLIKIHELDTMTKLQKDWVLCLLRVRSPLDEPCSTDKKILESIQKHIRENET